MTRPFAIVVATDRDLGIGKNGTLPWRLKGDMLFFKTMTTSGEETNSVIMGRKTWESIPAKFRPLPGRTNIVLTRSGQGFVGAITAATLDEALAAASGKIFVIGGGEIYREAIDHPSCTDMWITRVGGSFDCDTTFPRYDDRFRLDVVFSRFRENDIGYCIERWVKPGASSWR